MHGLTINQVTKAFGATRVLDRVSLDVREGEFVSLIGPSGCGKSTLLRIVAGLEPQDGGTVSIGGRAVDAMPPKGRDVAMVFQSYALYPHMTALANIALPLRMRRLSTAQRLPLVGRLLPGARAAQASIDRDVARVAEAVGIGGLLGRRPGQLSGGQRQRVAVARAMVREPRLFLMDEPLSNLDAELRAQMRHEIRDLHRRLGVAFLYVTHDQAEAMSLSDRVAVLEAGRLLQVGTPQALYADPASLRVAGFIGTPRINLLDAAADGDGVLRLAGAALPLAQRLPPGTACTLGIRPDGVVLSDRPGALPATVRFVEHLGAEAHAHLTLAAGPAILLAAPSAMLASLRPGTPVRVAFAPGAALFFGADGARLGLPAQPSLAAAVPA